MPLARLLRDREDDESARVSNTELVFDLVYAFAVTQISHLLPGIDSAAGIGQALVLWFAVWLGWQYTCWFTNWFNPDALPVRLCIFATMPLALVLAAAIPQAFGPFALVFALCYLAAHIGRQLAAVLILGRHELAANYRRLLGWSCISALFWIGGALAPRTALLPIWAVAVGIDYVCPMFGFWLPFMGRSRTTDWTIAGRHLAERCQSFVLMAIGESIVVTGSNLADAGLADPRALAGFVVAFISSMAVWWLYFDTSSEAGMRVISRSSDPGRIGALFHYVHVGVVGGIIVMAAANNLLIAAPAGPMDARAQFLLLGGPVLYLMANGLYKTVVYDRFPLSHVVGLAGFALLIAPVRRADHLLAATLVMALLVVVAIWERRSRLSGDHQSSSNEPR